MVILSESVPMGMMLGLQGKGSSFALGGNPRSGARTPPPKAKRIKGAEVNARLQPGTFSKLQQTNTSGRRPYTSEGRMRSSPPVLPPPAAAATAADEVVEPDEEPEEPPGEMAHMTVDDMVQEAHTAEQRLLEEQAEAREAEHRARQLQEWYGRMGNLIERLEETPPVLIPEDAPPPEYFELRKGGAAEDFLRQLQDAELRKQVAVERLVGELEATNRGGSEVFHSIASNLSVCTSSLAELEKGQSDVIFDLAALVDAHDSADGGALAEEERRAQLARANARLDAIRAQVENGRRALKQAADELAAAAEREAEARAKALEPPPLPPVDVEKEKLKQKVAMLTGKLGNAASFMEALVAGVARDADAQLQEARDSAEAAIDKARAAAEGAGGASAAGLTDLKSVRKALIEQQLKTEEERQRADALQAKLDELAVDELVASATAEAEATAAAAMVEARAEWDAARVELQTNLEEARELLTLQTSATAEAEEHKDRLQERVDELSADVAEMRPKARKDKDEIESLTSKLEIVNGRLSAAEGKVALLEKAAGGDAEAAAAAEAAARAAEVAAASQGADAAAAHAQIETLQRQLQDSSEEVEKLKAALEAAEGRAREMADKHGATADEAAAAAAAVAEAAAATAAAEVKKAEAAAARASELEAALAEANAALAEKQSVNPFDMYKAQAGLTAQLDDAKAQIDALQRELEAAHVEAALDAAVGRTAHEAAAQQLLLDRQGDVERERREAVAAAASAAAEAEAARAKASQLQEALTAARREAETAKEMARIAAAQADEEVDLEAAAAAAEAQIEAANFAMAKAVAAVAQAASAVAQQIATAEQQRLRDATAKLLEKAERVQHAERKIGSIRTKLRQRSADRRRRHEEEKGRQGKVDRASSAGPRKEAAEAAGGGGTPDDATAAQEAAAQEFAALQAAMQFEIEQLEAQTRKWKEDADAERAKLQGELSKAHADEKARKEAEEARLAMEAKGAEGAAAEAAAAVSRAAAAEEAQQRAEAEAARLRDELAASHAAQKAADESCAEAARSYAEARADLAAVEGEKTRLAATLEQQTRAAGGSAAAVESLRAELRAVVSTQADTMAQQQRKLGEALAAAVAPIRKTGMPIPSHFSSLAASVKKRLARAEEMVAASASAEATTHAGVADGAGGAPPVAALVGELAQELGGAVGALQTAVLAAATAAAATPPPAIHLPPLPALEPEEPPKPPSADELRHGNAVLQRRLKAVMRDLEHIKNQGGPKAASAERATHEVTRLMHEHDLLRQSRVASTLKHMSVAQELRLVRAEQARLDAEETDSPEAAYVRGMERQLKDDLVKYGRLRDEYLLAERQGWERILGAVTHISASTAEARAYRNGSEPWRKLNLHVGSDSPPGRLGGGRPGGPRNRYSASTGRFNEKPEPPPKPTGEGRPFTSPAKIGSPGGGALPRPSSVPNSLLYNTGPLRTGTNQLFMLPHGLGWQSRSPGTPPQK